MLLMAIAHLCIMMLKAVIEQNFLYQKVRNRDGKCKKKKDVVQYDFHSSCTITFQNAGPACHCCRMSSKKKY